VKKKPEMKDAVTQTDRSDYAIIKARNLARQAREKQQEASLIASQNRQGIVVVNSNHHNQQ
jgi:hypothetical protein